MSVTSLATALAAPPMSTDEPLPLEWEVPGGLPATPPPARHLRLVAPPPEPICATNQAVERARRFRPWSSNSRTQHVQVTEPLPSMRLFIVQVLNST